MVGFTRYNSSTDTLETWDNCDEVVSEINTTPRQFKKLLEALENAGLVSGLDYQISNCFKFKDILIDTQSLRDKYYRNRDII